ncbi:NAD(P)/FAD-dependent oxidoreductase [Methylobacterium sp. ID0610]|uniref:NAD(P)/FAD-dependent oxidoreductase n=1 Tax=Methylobacterium carpenticola TaxID=3344827 RepID=UPI0036997E05
MERPAVETLKVDVAIIGGGTAACAAAVALREAGLTVAVLEKRLCGAGASGVNFGGVRQQGRDLAELPLSRRARALWDGLDAKLGEAVEFEATGHIKLARSEADMAVLEAYARDAAAHGLDLQLLGPNALRAEMPWLGPAVVGASLSPTDGQANPRVVGPAYARLARRRGAQVREHAPVRHALHDGAGFAVEAEGVAVRSRILVNAAGAFAGTVAGWFGEAAPVAPLAPNMVVTEPLPILVTRSIGVVGGDVYLRQTRRGNVVLGGGRGTADVADGLARPVAATSLGAMGRTLTLVPDLAHAQVIRTWSGLDGEMPDHIPVIGPSATTPGLLHAFGFSGHGFQLGPVVGEILAELATQGRSASPLHPFRIERFAGWQGGPPRSEGEIEH